jgi:aspartate/methionine/tyrosine aminotransferase
MFDLVPFALEDFLYEYEHRPDVVNLATSDTLPWTLGEVKYVCPDVSSIIDKLNFEYPDVKQSAIEAIRTFHSAPDWIGALPTAGAAEAIFLALHERLVHKQAGFRIAVPRPGFGAFEGISRLFGFEVLPYGYRRERGWQVDSEELVALASECDAILVNSPHNPTGRVLEERILRELISVADGRGSTLIIDEVFRLPTEIQRSSWTSENVVVVGSLSKMYGLPGLRFGWVVGAKGRIERMRTLQQYLTLSASSLSTALGPFVLNHVEAFSRRALIERNRRMVVDWAKTHESLLKLSPTEGGNTTVLEILYSVDERQLFDAFLENSVLLTPGGRCFGVSDCTWFRLGYGNDTVQLEKGLAQIENTLTKLRPVGSHTS